MHAIEEQLRALEQLEALQSADVDAERRKINAKIRDIFRRDAAAARTFLQERDICDPEQSFVAGSLVEALAGGEDAEIRILQWYFGVVQEQLARCPDVSSASLPLGSYAFLEHEGGARKFDMLPQYLSLARAPEPALRRAAVDLLAGFTVATAPGVRDELLRLLSDADWKVRRGAEDLLREEGILPAGYRPSLLDRIRRLISR